MVSNSRGSLRLLLMNRGEGYIKIYKLELDVVSAVCVAKVWAVVALGNW